MMIYKTLGRSNRNCTPPVWSTTVSNINIDQIQYTQYITSYNKMSSIYHIYNESSRLQLEINLNLFSAKYLI